MNEDWQLRWVRVPGGTHLSGSKGSAGVDRDLLRDDRTNKLLGPTESVPANIDEIRESGRDELKSLRPTGARELSPAQQALADTIADVLEIVTRDIVVPVMREVVVPAVSRKLNQVKENLLSTTKSSRGRLASAEREKLRKTSTVESPADVIAVEENRRIAMSGVEFRERLLETLAAERYAAEQRGVLASARIEDPEVSRELERAMKLILEGKIDEVDEATLAAVVVFFRRPECTTDQRELRGKDGGHGNASRPGGEGALRRGRVG